MLKYFKNGEWTISVKGRPFHNIALDEAHESIVNRKLKQITSRPSHFRMVKLADFMSYVTGFAERDHIPQILFSSYKAF